jgi:hypothetical protein
LLGETLLSWRLYLSANWVKNLPTGRLALLYVHFTTLTLLGEEPSDLEAGLSEHFTTLT